MTTPTRVRVLRRMAAMVVVPSVPVLIWWKVATDDRRTHTNEVTTRVKVPNVPTIDDLMIDRCLPGDVIVFDRRCEKCAAGPMAALACILSKTLLCNNDDDNDGGQSIIRAVDGGTYDHCGIVVPGPDDKKNKQHDPSNLLLLEATPSHGIVARPLLTRLEMSQSRSVVLLPLLLPGERRYDDDDDDDENDTPNNKRSSTKQMRHYIAKQLTQFTTQWTTESQKQNYAKAHSTLSIVGALQHALHVPHSYRSSFSPISPAAWLVVSALQSAGVAEHISDSSALGAKTEDFLRDCRFVETDTVRLRPGYKFLPAVLLRETSRS